jgi:hypothetical protein
LFIPIGRSTVHVIKEKVLTSLMTSPLQIHFLHKNDSLYIVKEDFCIRCIGKKINGTGSIRPGKWVDSPHLIALNIIIDEAFFDNFLVIIYLLVVYKKNNNIK